MNFAEAARRDYEALLLMLETSYKCIKDRGLEARLRRDMRTAEVARVALTALLESTLQGLNAHVDSAIAAASLATDAKVTVTKTKEQRENRLKDLEKRFRFAREELGGWAAVKLTNDQTNAVKHRLGLTFRSGERTELSIAESVDLTEPELLIRLDAVQHWIVELGRKVGLVAVT